jgi:DNA-binding transcriptional LysR family regulator
MEEHIKTLATNWNDFKYFFYLAKHQRLSRVAEILDTSHVTVANRISALENILKTKLFTRQPEGYYLTTEGEKLLNHIQKMERAILNGIRESSEGLSRKENIDLDYLSLPKITNITGKTVDISISLECPTSEYVIRKKLTNYTLGIFASKKYIDNNKLISSDNLTEHRWIGYIENLLFTEELKYHEEISKNLDYSFRSTSIMAQIEATKEGLGLAIIPLYMAEQSNELTRVAEDTSFQRTYWITSNSDLHRFEPVKKVWNYILETCSADSEHF